MGFSPDLRVVVRLCGQGSVPRPAAGVAADTEAKLLSEFPRAPRPHLITRWEVRFSGQQERKGDHYNPE